jgi:protein-L-isoaspartate(D-aspartate) O-methyltransferase
VGVELARSLEAMGISDPAVLRAFAEVPRELFVPGRFRDEADADRPLPIGFGQTISQPYVVAFMTERLGLRGTERVLEIGTGSGYQTAILAHLAREVFSVEIIPALAEAARALLVERLGYRNVSLRVGDGAEGWPEAAPFDAILVAAAAPEIPRPLLDQLAPGGRMIIPVGGAPEVQSLRLVVRGNDGASLQSDLLPVRFVPLTGPAGR